MSIRGKVLALFFLFAVAPLLALGVFSYVRSAGALQELVRTQTTLIASRAATELGERYASEQANLGLLTDNVETERILRAGSRASGANAARAEPQPYLSDVWRAIGRDFDWASLRDSAGVELLRLGTPADGPDTTHGYIETREVREPRSGRLLGTVQVALRLDSLLPRTALDARLGRRGSSLVIDRAGDSVLFEARGDNAPIGGTSREVLGAWRRWSAGAASHGDTAGSFTAGDSGSTTIAGVVDMGSPRFSIISLATLEEFSPAFVRIGHASLIMVAVVALTAAIAFILALWSVTHSLSALTLAAVEVGRGNLRPTLPSAGNDEVGVLTREFGRMTARVQTMMAEVEQSRQMAAVGAFASEISHEIRNPLTAIKLNLQKLERAATQRQMPEELTRHVDLSLRGVERLDRVVRGVLRLGRRSSTDRDAVSLAEALAAALDAARPDLERRGITVMQSASDPDAVVIGDRTMLEGVFLNLFTNAAEAMPNGGTLSVALEVDEAAGSARVRIEDDGPGVAEADRSRMFLPFHTTKADGTGLGLSLAQRTVEELNGRIVVTARSDGARGAAFVVELPRRAQSPTELEGT
jgi:signal transduction histidine kinase